MDDFHSPCTYRQDFSQKETKGGYKAKNGLLLSGLRSHLGNQIKKRPLLIQGVNL
jgi:hypothetical protein